MHPLVIALSERARLWKRYPGGYGKRTWPVPVRELSMDIVRPRRRRSSPAERPPSPFGHGRRAGWWSLASSISDRPGASLVDLGSSISPSDAECSRDVARLSFAFSYQTFGDNVGPTGVRETGGSAQFLVTQLLLNYFRLTNYERRIAYLPRRDFFELERLARVLLSKGGLELI